MFWGVQRRLTTKNPWRHFVRRKFSPELLEKLVGPFVSGIYAGDPEKLGLRSAFPQLYEAEKSAGSVMKGLMRGGKNNKTPRQRSPPCKHFAMAIKH